MKKQRVKQLVSLCLTVVMLFCMMPFSVAAGEAEFKNGPYLLAPKTTGMVVAWESTEKATATIAFGTDEDALGAPISVAADASAPNFQGKKMNLFAYKFENLEPDTRYYYEVTLTGGESCKASFKTLSDKPEDVNIITLSDSHIFATRSELDASVKSYDPDVILHCGDLVEGTGAQAEQFSFWFGAKEENDFIHSYPVIYTAGNHDMGGSYFDAYVYNIQDREYGAEVAQSSSMRYGDIYIANVNSNPWGLFQMNSEATGNPVDAATLKQIENEKNWLKKDLASEKATTAAFRIVFMHHPVSDAYTKRHMPEILEAGNVDLMLSGHTHKYARAVSDNPAVGAGTIYLTHQDARTYSKYGDFFHITGNTETGILNVSAYGAVDAASETKLAKTTVLSSKKQQLSWDNISIAPNEILYNGELSISATVTNEGDGIAAAVLPVYDNGEVRYLYEFEEGVITLSPGESVKVTGTLRMETLGKHTVSLADKSVTVNVSFRKATFDYTNLRTKLGDDAVSNIDSNVLNIKADVVNIGNENGSTEASFIIDGKTIATKLFSLDSGKTKTVEFRYTFDKAGEYEVAIGNAKPQKIYIEGSIQGMPIVKDKSSNGNNGYIHGAPEFGKDDKGAQTLILDGFYDYIEVPDEGGYKTNDGITGMVWANLPSKGTTKGGVSELGPQYEDLDGKGSIPDHNPLMVKGIGLGWGTPYLFRIAVRETGKVTYGVCLLDDNGEFSWNDGNEVEAGIKKDTWVQYTSAFDFTSGGDSYQNGYNSAHVDKPAFTAPMKNWEGQPLYIGLGFKNTLLTNRNRGMYHTMLPGAVSQVRFYDSKVSAEENDALRANPTSAGTSAKNLKIWLDFESKNIDLVGTHTTEWVKVSAADSLSYNAEIKGGASITAVVQTSNDGKTVAKQKEIKLQTGNNKIDLSEFSAAAYIRIQSKFVSDLNAVESSVPVLNEYVIFSNDKVLKRFNTLTDWQKGTFDGAVRHQSSDVYRDHAKDFDNYGDSLAFEDIENHWAKESILYVANNGLFTGTSSTTFSPETGMTRGMFVTVLGRAANEKGSASAASAKFTDISGKEYYAPYVAWALENEIVKGTSATTFGPNEQITREQMSTIIYNYFKANGNSLDEGTVQFSDNKDIAQYAITAVSAMQNAGLINGKENNRFDPKGKLTRAEGATIMERVLKTAA